VNVFDASALLAFLQGEVGADATEAALEEGGSCGAANWSEVAQKIRASGRDWMLARALLQSYDLAAEPVLVDDAELAARLWRKGSGHSLGDRLCLALGERLDATVLTADRSWGTKGRIRQVR
jgi:PIN domain nuclease of toxin-antitoxin system